MQPRQRSKCSTTVRLSATVPSSRASISWMRPRGESISSFQSRYVGQVGRQKPQWTHSRVSSRITRSGEHRPSGRTGRGSARSAARTAAGGSSWVSSGTYAMPAAGRTTASPIPASVSPRRPGRSAAARARRPGARGPRSRRRRRPRRLRRVPRPAAPDPRPQPAALEEHRDATGVEDVERARLQLGAAKVATTAAGSSVSTTTVRAAAGAGGAGARRARSTRACRASRRRACPGRTRRRS